MRLYGRNCALTVQVYRTPPLWTSWWWNRTSLSEFLGHLRKFTREKGLPLNSPSGLLRHHLCTIFSLLLSSSVHHNLMNIESKPMSSSKSSRIITNPSHCPRSSYWKLVTSIYMLILLMIPTRSSYSISCSLLVFGNMLPMLTDTRWISLLPDTPIKLSRIHHKLIALFRTMHRFFASYFMLNQLWLLMWSLIRNFNQWTWIHSKMI